MLVLPHTFVYLSGELTDFHDIGGFISNQLLQILLHSEWPIHLGDVLHAPAPQVARFGPRSVPPPHHLLALASLQLA